MKNIQIILCTPDMYRPTAKQCIYSIKKTDLSKTELIIADNGYDNHFSHPKIMDSFFTYAENRHLILIDDDVIIDTYEWVDQLLATAEQRHASIVGCIHTYPSGEINHHGILVYRDGTTELMREPLLHMDDNPYVPAVSSAVMLITDASKLNIDTRYTKYQHDTDICISAWQKGNKVALCSDLKITHKLANYMSSRPNFRKTYASDSRIMIRKWAEFCQDQLFARPELMGYLELSSGPNWEKKYNRASLLSESHPEEATILFKQIIDQCPQKWRRSSAHYHLFQLNKQPAHLEKCLSLNPQHEKAREQLAAINSGA